MTDWIQNLMDSLGYLGILLLMILENLFPPIPSELIMPSAGFAAARGDMTLPLVILMGTLGSVAPDLHDLLAVSRELNDMLAKLPGFGRIKRRIDEEQGEDETDATVRD